MDVRLRSDGNVQDQYRDRRRLSMCCKGQAMCTDSTGHQVWSVCQWRRPLQVLCNNTKQSKSQDELHLLLTATLTCSLSFTIVDRYCSQKGNGISSMQVLLFTELWAFTFLQLWMTILCEKGVLVHHKSFSSTNQFQSIYLVQVAATIVQLNSVYMCCASRYGLTANSFQLHNIDRNQSTCTLIGASILVVSGCPKRWKENLVPREILR